ncbi:hypothetical protein BDV96DRAFT_603823 [Lophiotrema nucula]|uniref:Uncharacterized protein n=1 Tax=Lophiotrema nucula TaxID=690887 RepID=A0A6A5YX95_9PLEO|nr:hypothetical protein BDV96DRAFT_603823 [Lophiotrema nucula]
MCECWLIGIWLRQLVAMKYSRPTLSTRIVYLHHLTPPAPGSSTTVSYGTLRDPGSFLESVIQVEKTPPLCPPVIDYTVVILSVVWESRPVVVIAGLYEWHACVRVADYIVGARKEEPSILAEVDELPILLVAKALSVVVFVGIHEVNPPRIEGGFNLNFGDGLVDQRVQPDSRCIDGLSDVDGQGLFGTVLVRSTGLVLIVEETGIASNDKHCFG